MVALSNKRGPAAGAKGACGRRKGGLRPAQRGPAAGADGPRGRRVQVSAGFLLAVEHQPRGRKEGDRPGGQGGDLGGELVHAGSRAGGPVAEDRGNG